LIHFSTDGVFDGKRGSYLESDDSNAKDWYGETKYLGELNEEHTLTLRISIIGFELMHKKSLLEWFLSQKNSVRGFKKAIFSGPSTLEMARIIEHIIINFKERWGVYHVASGAISKYDLLCLIKKAFNLKLEIIPDEDFQCDRSLIGDKFNQDFEYTPPSWENMVQELAGVYNAMN